MSQIDFTPPAGRGMTKKEVAELFKISTKTVERNSKTGRLPKPIYVGERSPRWNREEVYAIYNGTNQAQDKFLSSSR